METVAADGSLAVKRKAKRKIVGADGVVVRWLHAVCCASPMLCAAGG